MFWSAAYFFKTFHAMKDITRLTYGTDFWSNRFMSDRMQFWTTDTTGFRSFAMTWGDERIDWCGEMIGIFFLYVFIVIFFSYFDFGGMKNRIIF